MGKDRQKREIDEIVRELKIIREQLKHPNIVRYYSTFQESKLPVIWVSCFMANIFMKLFGLFS